MQINISTRNGQLSPATQEKIRSKVQKLAKFYDMITSFEVTVNLKDESAPAVEVRVTAELVDDLVANDRKENLLSSLDSVIHKLEQQIKRHKEKLQDHRGPGRRAVVDEEVSDPAET